MEYQDQESNIETNKQRNREMYDFDSLYLPLPDWHQPNHHPGCHAVSTLQCEYNEASDDYTHSLHEYKGTTHPEIAAEQAPAIISKKVVQWTSITINALHGVPMSSQMGNDERCSLWWQPNELMEFKNSKRREDNIDQRRKQALLRHNGVKRVLNEQRKLAHRNIVFDPDTISVAMCEFNQVAQHNALKRANELTLSLRNDRTDTGGDAGEVLARVELLASSRARKRKRSSTSDDFGRCSKQAPFINCVCCECDAISV